jgi:AcrR family transcriptional regulator
MPDLTDRRVQKTRQILQKAIMELIVEKGFKSITVQDILDKANVGRSTFYAHYQDKGELLHSCFEEFHKLMEQHALNLSEGNPSSYSLEFNTGFILKFLKFAEQNRQLLKALLAQEDLSETIKNSLFESVYGPVKRNLGTQKNNQIPPEFVVQYFVNACFGAIKWWITNDMPYTADEVDNYIKQLTIPAIKGLHNNNSINDVH